jgi:CBS domain-containing membrane protein
MTNNTHISTIMTACPVVGNTSTKFSQVLRLFTEFPVHHLPIVDEDNKLIGIVSSNDLPKVFLSLCHHEEPIKMTIEVLDNEVIVADLMTPNPVTIGSTDPISKAIEIFAEKKFMALPVVDNGTLVGILSIKDVIAYEEAIA